MTSSVAAAAIPTACSCTRLPSALSQGAIRIGVIIEHFRRVGFVGVFRADDWPSRRRDHDTTTIPTAIEATRALRPLAPRDRIGAIADPGSVERVTDALSAPRPSPHLARWGIAAQDDDGVVLARAAIFGAPVFIAAQDERFLGGSAGANHADALRELLELALAERPAAVILLAASGGVRLHEANPAEWALARALAAMQDLRAAGVRVLTLGVGDVFGGASVLACAADRTALLPGTKFGLSGPKVIETARGSGEIDAGDAAAVDRLFGAEARADAGDIELVTDDIDIVRAWVAACLRDDATFPERVRGTQKRLAERLAVRAGLRDAGDVERGPMDPLLQPPLSELYGNAQPVDRSGWLWRIDGRRVWLTRPSGQRAFGPRDAHAIDKALLAHLAGDDAPDGATLVLVEDSPGHEASVTAEVLCVSQYLAQHAAVLGLLRARGVRIVGLLAGTGHSAAFFANALQASRVGALAGARVVAMEPGGDCARHATRSRPARRAHRGRCRARASGPSPRRVGRNRGNHAGAECCARARARFARRLSGTGYLPGPITQLGNPVAMPGTRQISTMATNMSATNGSTPQTTSRSGMSGAMFLMTKRLSPTGG